MSTLSCATFVCLAAVVASQACIDNNDLCAFWSGVGECQKNAPFMLAECRPSCGVCEATGTTPPPTVRCRLFTVGCRQKLSPFREKCAACCTDHAARFYQCKTSALFLGVCVAQHAEREHWSCTDKMRSVICKARRTLVAKWDNFAGTTQ